MAQIFGHFGTKSPVEWNFAQMGERIRRPGQELDNNWAHPKHLGGLGALLANEYGMLEVHEDAEGDCVLVVDGRLIRAAHEVSGRPAASATQNLAHQLAERYRARGATFVNDLHGSFALGLFDTARQRLLLATDRFGTRSLYWTHLGGHLTFASELKALLALPGLEVRADPQAISCYLRYGRLFGRRTIWKGVRRLAAGGVLEYDLSTDQVRESTYFQAASLVQERHPLSAVRREALIEAFRRAVLRSCPENGTAGLSLSGGLDSRAIVAVLAGAKRNAVLHTEGLEGCMDERVAARIARLTGLPWQFSPLTQAGVGDYLESLRLYVYLTDGMMVPDGFPGLSPNEFAMKAKAAVLLRGHGGENARMADAWPFQVSRQVLAWSDRSMLAPRLESNGADLDGLALFTEDDTRKALAEPEESYRSHAARMDSGLTPAEVLSLMYLDVVGGNLVPTYRNSLRGQTDMGLPYMDEDFLGLVLGTRLADRCDSTIHHALVERHCPALMKVPNSNNGAPLSASKVRLWATDKVHTLLRRLRWRGFRHYHESGSWMQSLLRQKVHALLTERRTLQRGLFNSRQLMELLERPAVPSHLLPRLVTLEMWHRLFADRDLEKASLEQRLSA